MRKLLLGFVVGLAGLASAAAQPAAPKQPAPAYVEARLPANAELTFDGTPTKQRGPLRAFVTPPLDPAYKYSYELVATWKDKEGKPQAESTTVDVRAGQTSRVAFGMPEKIAPPKDKAQPKAKPKPPPQVKLFNGKDFTGWTMFLDPKKKVDPSEIWSIKDGVIHCQGHVNGYLLSDKEYGDYILKVEWRWGEKVHTKNKVRNSGVFVHVTGPDKIWPKSIEAQLMSGNAGDFWLVDSFKLDVDPSRQDPKQARHYFRMIKEGVEKPIGEWNKYEITCKADTIKLVINGKLVNEGKNAELSRGKILLQSEGAEIHFRNLTLRPLK